MVISRLKKFASNHLYIIFFLTVCLSYGQMLFMYVWKDDNAIFFKFNHLAEPAGYLGRGLLGEGPYRLSVAPYWFIYTLFGTSSLVPYYMLAFLFYFLASISIYKLFETFISKKTGIIAALLFCAGYVGSEGFYWLASSWILSVSIILTCFAVRSYYQFVQKPSRLRYFFSLLSYILCIEITPVRTHYVIALIVALEVLWGIDLHSRKRIIRSLLRLIPFICAFYFIYVIGADSRTTSIATYFLAIKNGTWYEFYSFFATSGNIFLTDIQSKFVFGVIKPILALSFGSLLYKFASVLLGCIVVYRQTRSKFAVSVFSVVVIIWTLFLKAFLTAPQITLFENAQYILYASGVLLLTLLFSVFQKMWRLHVFLLVWLVTSLAVYTSYIPTGYYSSIDRYVAHSFVAFVGIIACYAQIKHVSKIFVLFIMFWAGSNLYSSITSQKAIIVNRSIPAKNFYTELRQKLPEIKKGDIVYIDVSESERDTYAAAFSVGQMPESTAIAWRYGLDRYDFLLVNSFADSLLKEKEGVQYPGSVHSFFYNNGHITDTSSEYKALKDTTKMAVPFTSASTKNTTLVTFLTPLSSVRPLKLTVSLRARPDVSKSLVFPFKGTEVVNTKLVSSAKFRSRAYEYESFKNDFLQQATVSASSSWQERQPQNLIDAHFGSVWQPDRILWHDGRQFLNIDMKKPMNINKIVWANGFENNSPTSFTVQTSLDGNNFETVAEVNAIRKIPSNVLQETPFEPVDARHIRVIYHASLNDDSPGISEIFPVASRFKDYSITDFEGFISRPFAFVSDAQTYDELVAHFRDSHLQLSWLTDKQARFDTSELNQIKASYDNNIHSYTITIPAGGTILKQLKFYSGTIPGEITVSQINVQYE